MEHENRNQAAGRDDAANNAGHDPAAPRDRESGDPATAPATRLPEPGPDAEPVVICAWCPSLHVLKLQRREQDVVIIYWQGKELRIIRNGVNLKISHTICSACRERMHTDGRTHVEQIPLALRLESWIAHARSENSLHVSIPLDAADILLAKVKP